MRLIVAIAVSAGMTALTVAVLNRIAATRKILATDTPPAANGS
jgi:hypothetical protein